MALENDSRILTTLCYIEKDRSYLMMHRITKENDINEGKWIGVGGHFREAESPEECLLREVKEETGLDLTSFRLRGIVTFISEGWGYEYMFLYSADGFEGQDPAGADICDEGVLQWVPWEQIPQLNLWAGDRIFLDLLMKEERFFSLKLVYSGDELIQTKLTI